MSSLFINCIFEMFVHNMMVFFIILYSRIMSGHSDFECEMVSINSFGGHKVAPDDCEYPIKIKPLEINKFFYTLKKGQSLPYSPELNGIHSFFYLVQV